MVDRAQIIAAWKRYGVSIERDAFRGWSWAETEDETGEINGPFSPAFNSFDACVGDLIDCFGPLEAQVEVVK